MTVYMRNDEYILLKEVEFNYPQRKTNQKTVILIIRFVKIQKCAVDTRNFFKKKRDFYIP